MVLLAFLVSISVLKFVPLVIEHKNGEVIGHNTLSLDLVGVIKKIFQFSLVVCNALPLFTMHLVVPLILLSNLFYLREFFKR